MQARDKNIIDFINLAELATREQLQKLFFQGVHQNVPMRRLKKLAEDEYIQRHKYEANTWIYMPCDAKKISKRILHHDLYITDFLVKLLNNDFEIIEFKKSWVIGPIISDAYIRYKNKEGKIKHCVLEIQLSNKVEDCVNKYSDFKNIILENRRDFETIPRIVVITDMKQRIELRGIKVLYDDTTMSNIINLL